MSHTKNMASKFLGAMRFCRGECGLPNSQACDIGFINIEAHAKGGIVGKRDDG